MRKSVVAAAVAGAVVVGAGLGVGVSQMLSSPQDVQSVASATASTAAGLPEATSLDDIVPGSGARAQSTLLPGVGVNFPATCIGAAQAAASWQASVVNMASPLYVGLVESSTGDEQELLGVRQALEDEVLGAGGVESTTVYGVTRNLFTLPARIGVKGEREETTVYLHPKAFRLESCTEGERAIATTVAAASMKDGAIKDQDVVGMDISTFVLDAADGAWRITAVESSACGFVSSSGQDLGEAGEQVNSPLCALDVDRIPGIIPTLTALPSSASRPGYSAAQLVNEVTSGLGRGTHHYVEAES